jgi:cellulose biosynthesis protein BcsQ
MEKRVTINYKTDGRLNYARINLNKDLNNLLNLSEKNNQVLLEYINNEIILKPVILGIAEQITKVEENIIYMKNISKLSYEKSKGLFKLLIPLGIAKKWELEKNNIVDMIIYDDKIVIRPYKEEKVELENKLLPIFAFKVVKGGVGKTFFSTQIATGLGATGIKVLFITLDSQNDALDMLLKSKSELNEKTEKMEKIYKTFDKDEYKINKNCKGLKYWIKYGTGELVKVRENVDYIPLESPFTATAKTKENFENFIKKVRKNHNYDCIIIDSPPTEKIDQIILNQATKLIIPAYADKFTVKGIVTAIEEAGVNKVASILFNRYDDTTVEKEYYEEVQKIVKDTGIYCPEPIKKLSIITKLLDESKTIWESGDQRLRPVQEKLTKLLQILLEEIEG